MEITTRYLAEKLGIEENTLNVVAFDTAMVALVGTVALTIIGAISMQAAVLFGAVFLFIRNVTLEELDGAEPVISLFHNPLFFLPNNEEPSRRSGRRSWDRDE